MTLPQAHDFFPLLKLPTELRIMVYNHILDHGCYTIARSIGTSSITIISPSILCVSLQITREIYQLCRIPAAIEFSEPAGQRMIVLGFLKCHDV